MIGTPQPRCLPEARLAREIHRRSSSEPRLQLLRLPHARRERSDASRRRGRCLPCERSALAGRSSLCWTVLRTTPPARSSLLAQRRPSTGRETSWRQEPSTRTSSATQRTSTSDSAFGSWVTVVSIYLQPSSNTLARASRASCRSDFQLYHGHRNLAWTYLKNMPGWLFWLYLPYHLVLNLYSLITFSLRGQGGSLWRAKRDAVKGLGRFWTKASRDSSAAGRGAGRPPSRHARRSDPKALPTLTASSSCPAATAPRACSSGTRVPPRSC